MENSIKIHSNVDMFDLAVKYTEDMFKAIFEFRNGDWQTELEETFQEERGELFDRLMYNVREEDSELIYQLAFARMDNYNGFSEIFKKPDLNILPKNFCDFLKMTLKDVATEFACSGMRQVIEDAFKPYLAS